MSAQRQAEDAATADTVIHPPRPPLGEALIEPDLSDTIVPAGVDSPAASIAPDPESERDPESEAEPEPVPELQVAPADPAVEAASPRRPRHYAFRVEGRAEVITLDSPSYVGRRPRPPRVPHAGVPQLVSVDSPLREVSATHLEIRQVGSSIVVRDLASTNGSIVHLPGRGARTLRQGESIVVLPGTLVDIGDKNVIHILPAQGPS